MRLIAQSVLIALLLYACEQSAIDPSQSLVGAKQLPSAEELSREAIQINRGFGNISPGFLSYELRPDDVLIVSLTDRKYPADDVVLVKDTFQLTQKVAAEARKTLWRIRPAGLRTIDEGGLEWTSRPVGCNPRGPHDFGELAVVFIAEGPKPDVNDHRLGVFELPTTESCDTPEAVEARKLVQQVLRSFPSSKAPLKFEQRQAELFD